MNRYDVIGAARIRLVGACPEDVLQLLSGKRIRFWGYEKRDELTAYLWVPERKIGEIKQCARKAMCELEVLETRGVFLFLKKLRWRVLMLPILLLMVLLTLFAESRIWFITVEGNETIPEQQIRRALSDVGVDFWCSARDLDLNLIKNEILSQVPEIGWITIERTGAVAKVVVREREQEPERAAERLFQNLVAEKPGIITRVTVSEGTPVVKAGDVVEAGQLLISGVTNLDKTILISGAAGEVYARTWNPVSAVLEKQRRVKVYTGEECREYALIVGKKQINFCKSSRISYDRYDKIIKIYPLRLPRGYTLPVSLCVSTLREYTVTEEPVSQEAAGKLLSEAAMEQLQGSLLAGEVISTSLEQLDQGNYYSLRGMAECREEITKAVAIQQ